MSNQSHKIAALILAAGASRRFGGGKQFAEVNGEGLLAASIRKATQAGCCPVGVVSGHRHRETEAVALAGGARCVFNLDWENGMQGSVIRGLRALLAEPGWDYTFLLPCDLPWFTERDFKDFEVARFSVASAKAEVVAIGYQDGPGIPLLLSRRVVGAYLAENESPPLRKFIAQQGKLVLLPPGQRTKDVDYRTDLPDEN